MSVSSPSRGARWIGLASPIDGGGDRQVALAMCAMNPEMRGRQYHVSYDLVKLTTGKMSGRRGRYLLADDLYAELKSVIVEKMRTRFQEKVRARRARRAGPGARAA